MDSKSKKYTAATFWAKVKTGTAFDCWPWTGALNTWGYGDVLYKGRRSNASRVAYLLSGGKVPKGLVVCHRCDNPACCNPKHLWVGTQAENLKDCRDKGRARVLSGEEHPRPTAKLTPKQVMDAKRAYANGTTQTALGLKYGVHSSTISRAVRGEKWAHLK